MAEKFESLFPTDFFNRFEVHSYRNAATLLASRYPEVFKDLLTSFQSFQLTKHMVRLPGGSRGPIVEHIDDKIGPSWRREARISADLTVKIKTKKPPHSEEYTREGFLDGHQIDYLYNMVALDVEWNSKDQTFDRDLYALSAFYESGAIDLGIILTRGKCIDDTSFLRDLGNVLTKDGKEGSDPVYKKFGASTTTMSKLLYRLEAGRNGGCPVLVLGLKTQSFT